MRADDTQPKDPTLTPWESGRFLKKITSQEARLSRGFLRSEPQKWFPGFAMQWLPLCHSLGIEARITDVQPFIGKPDGMERAFAAAVDDEPMIIMAGEESLRTLIDSLCPGALRAARGVVEEYLARRFITSLALSWSGPESSVVQFDATLDPASVKPAAGVKVQLVVNRISCEFFILLGHYTVERLDGLWKRQTHSTSRQQGEILDLGFEIAQLAVPPSLLAQYMEPRAMVDLEAAVSDRILLRNGAAPWAMARICDVDGHLGFELLEDPVTAPRIPEGTTRLAIEFGRERLEPALQSEIGQSGAVYETKVALDGRVNMMINSEKVAEADLMVYEGRFAIRVR